jgi:5-methylcytosine-specific restriction endonuclease McrA
MTLPPHIRAEVQRLADGDSAKLLGIKRSGPAAEAYKRVLRQDPCAYCGLPAPSHGHEVDHIRSRFKGGENHWENYTAACRFCNVAKHDMVLGHLWALRDLRRDIVPSIGDGPR